MLKKTMTYMGYDNVERTEDFYFDLTEAEVVEMEAGVTGGLKAKMEKLIRLQDSKQIIEIFKDIIIKSYGEKTADGRGFDKSPELTKAFMRTRAYSDLFMELAFNAESAIEFVNGIVPGELPEDELNRLKEQHKNPEITGNGQETNK